MRFIWFLILLVAGCALLFWVYQAMQSHDAPVLARPALSLPTAWQDGTTLQVRVLPDMAAGQSKAAEGPCGASYTVRRGDTLGEIAHRCGVSLESLLSANPPLGNPNNIETGQSLSIPRNPDQSGTIPDTAEASFIPGAVVEIVASGLPSDQPVRIGFGLSSTGYQQLGQAFTGPDGRLIAQIRLPGSARPGDSGFIMATTQGIPTRQVISATFIISSPPP